MGSWEWKGQVYDLGAKMNQIYDRVVRKYLIWSCCVLYLSCFMYYCLTYLFFAEFVSNLT